MEGQKGDRFEIGVCRWQYAVATVFFSIFTLALLWVAICGGIRNGDFILSGGVLCLAAISIAFAGIWLRRRPLYIIDGQGITDCGFCSQGFGLIRWENFQDFTPRWIPRSGLYIFIRVNNYNELVSRRNLLIQPLLLLNGVANGFLGGQISLAIGLSDTDLDTVSQQISHYSKNKFQMPAPLGPLAAFLPSFAASFVLLAPMVAIVIVLIAAYRLCHHM